jgi:protein-S-isoprenylcysteine O-methyltransferase Ste14
MDAQARDSAGVKVPPPLIYLAGLIIGFLAGKWLPNFSVPVVVSRTLGGLLIGLGTVLAFSAMRAFRKVGTTIRPDRPATTLANAGPYRFTRNPMYLSMAFAYAGIAILGQSLWALLILPAVLLVIRYRVIAREEPYLERQFGETYTNYKARVRRWI